MINGIKFRFYRSLYEQISIGHDTTTASMSFVLQILASYPEVMSKLQEEVDEKLGQVVISPDNVNQVKVSRIVSMHDKMNRATKGRNLKI